MRTSRILLPLMGLMLLTIATILVTAEVDWTDDVTDPSGDVDVLPPGGSQEASADILSISLGEEGDNMTVTMTLAGEYDGLLGSYNVTVIADGDDAKWYEFKLLPFFVTVTGHDLPTGTAEVNYSEDKKTIIWTLPKSEVSAVSGVEVQGSMATATQITGSTHIDYAPDVETGSGNGNGGEKNETTEPTKVTILWEVINLTHVRNTMKMYVQGDDADDMRDDFDTNEDGTVSQAEFDQLMAHIGNAFDEMNSTNMTLDGIGDDHTAFAMTYEGVVGTVTSGADVVMTMVLDMYFAEPEDKDTHTYSPDWEDDGSSDDDGMWNVTDDSWFKMTLPSGWEFDTNGWSSDLKGFLNSAGDKLEMTGTDLQTDWNATMGGVSDVIIKKEGTGADRDRDEGSPGFGTATALVAASVALLVALVRRRGSR